MYKYQYSLVACARWEETEIIEWIEYHQSIGFEHFYIYSNDDDPEVLFKVLLPYILGDNPIVTYTHWKKLGDQTEMYLDFIKNYKTQTKWAMFLDIDEFIALKRCENIDEFLKKFDKEVDCIYFNWLIYGNNGKKQRDNRSNLLTLTKRSANIDVHTKTIWRTRKVTEAVARQGSVQTGNPMTHFWNGYEFKEFVMKDVLGRPVDRYAENFPEEAYKSVGDKATSDKIISTAYIGHFIIKSEEDFLRRAARGGFAAQAMWRERYERNEHVGLLETLNHVEDTHFAILWLNLIQNKLVMSGNH